MEHAHVRSRDEAEAVMKKVGFPVELRPVFSFDARTFTATSWVDALSMAEQALKASPTGEITIKKVTAAAAAPTAAVEDPLVARHVVTTIDDALTKALYLVFPIAVETMSGAERVTMYATSPKTFQDALRWMFARSTIGQGVIRGLPRLAYEQGHRFAVGQYDTAIAIEQLGFPVSVRPAFLPGQDTPSRAWIQGPITESGQALIDAVNRAVRASTTNEVVVSRRPGVQVTGKLPEPLVMWMARYLEAWDPKAYRGMSHLAAIGSYLNDVGPPPVPEIVVGASKLPVLSRPARAAIWQRILGEVASLYDHCHQPSPRTGSGVVSWLRDLARDSEHHADVLPFYLAEHRDDECPRCGGEAGEAHLCSVVHYRDSQQRRDEEDEWRQQNGVSRGNVPAPGDKCGHNRCLGTLRATKTAFYVRCDKCATQMGPGPGAAEALETAEHNGRQAALREGGRDEELDRLCDEREMREEQIEQIHAALGHCNEEWSNHHDLGDCAAEEAEALAAKVVYLTSEVQEYKSRASNSWEIFQGRRRGNGDATPRPVEAYVMARTLCEAGDVFCRMVGGDGGGYSFYRGPFDTQNTVVDGERLSRLVSNWHDLGGDKAAVLWTPLPDLRKKKK